MWFLILKWIHVLAAIMAVGANTTYSIWIARATQEPKALPFVLKNVAHSDRQQTARKRYPRSLFSGAPRAPI